MPQPVDATGAFTPMQSAAELVDVLDNYLAGLKAGRAPDRAGLLALHPALADQLDSCLAALEFIHRTEQPAPSDAPAVLGDFRILRAIGRGGWLATCTDARPQLFGRILRKWQAARPGAVRRLRREARHEGPFLDDLLAVADEPLRIWLT